MRRCRTFLFFFFNDTATTEIYTLSLHDALPISALGVDAIAEFQILTNTYGAQFGGTGAVVNMASRSGTNQFHGSRSEDHTSELQSPDHLVCRLLLEKKKYSSNTTPQMSFSGASC